jgi:Tfp pilus assembly protein PilF
MTDADDTTNLKAQLAAHRRTLAILLRQVATHTEAYAPPAQLSGIDKARAVIAHLKAALRAAGVAVEDEIGDGAMPDEAARPAPSRPSRGFADQLLDLAAAQSLLDRLPLDHVPDPAPLPPGSRMPLRPNPLFVGREADLMALAPDLKAGRAAVISTGIGGVGKTQLAAEVAHRYGQFFAGGVFWLSFADPAGVDGEIAACGGAGALELYTDAAGLTQAEQVQRVSAAWQQPIPRLLIFDNCDDLPGSTAEQQLADRLPRSGGCRVLVTSRRGHWHASLGLAPRPLGVLNRTQSVALLQSHRNDLSDADASAIADMLGDLPLALSLAGSYLATYRAEAFGVPATYLTNLQQQLLEHRSLRGAGSAPSLTNHEQNVQATFALSYQRLDAANPVDRLAIAALARAAQLAPGEPFPRELLLATLGDDADEDSAVQRADALLRLVALGLLEDAQGGALRIHRLIAAFAQAATQDDAAQGAVEGALIRGAHQINKAGYPAFMQSVLAHLRHATDAALARYDDQAATLCTNVAYYLQLIGDYAGAKPLYERALAIYEQVLGPEHSETALSLSNLALLLTMQGDYAGAKPLYERALAIRERVLGPYHPQTALSLNNLAGLLDSQGDYAGAKSLLERALAIYEQVLGPYHPQTALSLNNLAEVLRNQRNDAGAKPLYERALAIYEQVLGPYHPSTAGCLNNLAALLHDEGNTPGAKLLYERALAIYEQVFGSYHPQTALILINLAGLLDSQGDYAGAKPLYERGLAICEQVLGLDHPYTAASLNNLAGWFARQGDDAGAKGLYERALTIYELCLGIDHPTTQTIRANLATLAAPPQPSEQEITDLTAQFEATVARALADPGSERNAFAEELEDLACLVEDGEAAESPYHALAAHLRTLAAQLAATDAEDTDTP